MRKFLILGFVCLLSACSYVDSSEYECPKISIPRETTRSYQNNGQFDEFQINLVGFESFCYTEPVTNRRYASITPTFKVRRLEASSVSSIDTSFYIKTSINAEDYLGIRNYNQVLNIPTSSKEVIVTGKQTITRIPTQPYNNFEIYIGMTMNNEALSKANKKFDIDYRYLSEDELAKQNDALIENVYLEVRDDEEVVYSEFDKKPIVVKKDRPQNNCQN